MKVKIWGCRGSLPTPGPKTVKYGGNTTCYELRSESGELLIIDAGSGIRELGLALLSELPVRSHIVISHTHWDHIMGYPFFTPLYIPGNSFDIYGPIHFNYSFEDVMKKQMDYTFFPVRMEELAAELQFHDIKEGEHQIGPFDVQVQYMNHPVLCLGFRIQVDGKTFVFTGDTEPYFDTVYGDREPQNEEEREEKEELDAFVQSQNQRVIEFLRDADLVIYDGAYTLEEYPPKKGWGHSPMEHCIETSLKANVKKLIITHHDPTRTDDQLDELLPPFLADLKSQGSSMELEFAVEGQTHQL